MPVTTPSLPFALPERTALVDIAPGEAFHRERVRLPTRVRVEVVAGLARTGLTEVVAARFAEAPEAGDDGAEVLSRAREDLGAPAGSAPRALLSARVQGPAGARRALEAGAEGLVVALPLAEGTSRKAHGCPAETARAAALEALALARAEGLAGAAVLEAAFGSPLDGPTDPAAVAELAADLTARAAEGRIALDRLTLADDGALADPVLTASWIARAREALGEGPVPLFVRPSDGRGLGPANALAALAAGARGLEGSLGAAGVSPLDRALPLASATEDLLYLVTCSGIALGDGAPGGRDLYGGAALDPAEAFSRLRRLARRLLEGLSRELPSRTLNMEPRSAVYQRVAARAAAPSPPDERPGP